jgi:hypothetical protein
MSSAYKRRRARRKSKAQRSNDEARDEREGEVGKGGVELTVDVQVILGKDLRSLVDGVTWTVEDSPKHVLRDGELHRWTWELDVGGFDVDSRRPLEHLAIRDGGERNMISFELVLSSVRDASVPP